MELAKGFCEGGEATLLMQRLFPRQVTVVSADAVLQALSSA